LAARRLAKRGFAACIPSKSNRNVAIPYDAILYKQRHKIENMFGRLKDWRRIHTMTVALTPTSRQSASQPPSSSGSDQRVLSLEIRQRHAPNDRLKLLL
jgi:hypothetical protein